MVFRRIYGEEIERVSVEAIEDDFKKQLATAKGKISQQKGLAAEYKVRYRLLAASLRGATLADVVAEPHPGPALDRFATIRKARVHLDQEHSVEVDLHAVSERADGTDLMIEVKDWQGEVTRDAVERFIHVKESLAGRLERRTVFLFYSESGLSDELAAGLAEAGILILDPEKLARYEAPPA